MVDQPQGPRSGTFLVRHGESSANRGGELVGRRDVHLTDKGVAQAARAARLLERELDDVASQGVTVLSSPLVHALDTAAPIAAALGTEVEVDERLVELDYGELEGTLFADLAPNWPPAWVADPSVPVPGGESYSALEARVGTAVDDPRARCSERGSGALVVVTHLGPVKAMVRNVLGGSPDLYSHVLVSHGSITRVIHQRRRDVLYSLNVCPSSS